jgi:hypothetical protein
MTVFKQSLELGFDNSFFFIKSSSLFSLSINILSSYKNFLNYICIAIMTKSKKITENRILTIEESDLFLLRIKFSLNEWQISSYPL